VGICKDSLIASAHAAEGKALTVDRNPEVFKMDSAWFISGEQKYFVRKPECFGHLAGSIMISGNNVDRNCCCLKKLSLAG